MVGDRSIPLATCIDLRFSSSPTSHGRQLPTSEAGMMAGPNKANTTIAWKAIRTVIICTSHVFLYMSIRNYSAIGVKNNRLLMAFGGFNESAKLSQSQT
jgi:hypothetical protein